MLLAALGGGSLLLGGCADTKTNPNAVMANDFGSALHQDLAAQITDTDPAVLAEGRPPASGARAALAQTRYRTGTVLVPVGQNTASSTSGGSGGGGGGGAP